MTRSSVVGHLPDAAFDFPERDAPPNLYYAICTSQRSGSNYLCGLLTETAALGAPFEYYNLNKRPQDMWPRLASAPGPFDVERYTDRLLRVRTSPNGVFGMKAHAAQFVEMQKLGLIERRYGSLRYIYLRRRDLIAQAVSLAIAQLSGRWHVHEPVRAEPAYNAKVIAFCLQVLRGADSFWAKHFAKTGIEPLTLVYEDVVEDPARSVAAVADYLGVEIAPLPDLGSTLYRRQATSRNVDWAERFLAERPAA